MAVACPDCDTPLLDSSGAPLKQSDSDYSRYGVHRTIQDDVKKRVREECGFGCVICGNMPTHYEHFDPPFKDLKHNHKADGMALLCTSCHERTKGNPPEIDKATVKFYRTNPDAKKKNSAKHPMFFLPRWPLTFKFGDVEFSGKRVNLYVTGQPVLSIYKLPNGTVGVDAICQNKQGSTVVKIKESVLEVRPSGVSDVVKVGTKFTISNGKRKILDLDKSNPHIMKVVGYETYFMGNHIQISAKGIFVNGEFQILAGGSLQVNATDDINIQLG